MKLPETILEGEETEYKFWEQQEAQAVEGRHLEKNLECTSYKAKRRELVWRQKES